MKIAFLTPEYPHPKTGSSGGIGTSIKNLAIGLLAEGCSVRVLVYGQKEEGGFEDNGIVIQQIKNLKIKGLSWWLTRKKLERIINQLYANNEIDVVEAPDWTGITSFIQPKKCPIVIRLNGSDTYFCHLDNRPVKWINKFHEKRALQKADALLSVSQFTADLTNEVFGLQKHFTIIPNSIDIGLFNSNSNSNENVNHNINAKNSKNEQKNLSVPSSPLLWRGVGGEDTILYFGSLIRKKGLLELPLIFNIVVQKNPETKLILIGKDVPDIVSGNPSTWQMMQQLFTNEALQNVSYLGSVPYQEIKSHIKTAGVCVFPTFAEALPVSWIEAMALQKPIVASNIGWAKEVIEDGVEGFLVNPKDHKKYAERILELLENPKLQSAFGVAARKKVILKFSNETVARQSLSFYKKCIASK
ncbi:glycosyltransferase family 4 protein [Flavobacterium franklandianum]|uniref:glycosyltransferase family 4 protein n=1 Tax=Flavobacterium franklandianum TaxID=2594430 RepID=UPI0011798CEC|nr:glycosyltransferase family 4 protein [Flavobacterium franklandianum]TRX24097.1 glycosyltransferase family 4 protein [Flavobacterium franklandianum]